MIRNRRYIIQQASGYDIEVERNRSGVMTGTYADLVYGSAAEALLDDQQFLRAWRNLHRRCVHATAYQAPGFVRAWYGAYRAQWQPVVVQSIDPNGELIGLWLLAYDPAMNVLSHAGTHQAEYHAWLALPGGDASFLVAAWAKLKQRLAFAVLHFKYLPAPELAKMLQSALGTENHVAIQLHSRPLLILNGDDVRASFTKYEYKRRFHGIKKLGTFEFRQLMDSADLERIFDDLIAYYDFRQGAVNHSTPFRDDPQKRKFHTDRFTDARDEVYVTAAYLDEFPIAAFWGAVSQKTVHLEMLIYSPFLAKYSPGRLHVTQLSEHLLKTGKNMLDLTPGGDPWKEHFSNQHDEVAEAIVYRSPWARIQTDARDTLFRCARRCISRFGVAPENVRSTLATLRRVRPSTVYRRLRAWVSADHELRIYRADRVLAKKYCRDVRVQCNSLRDLLCFESGEPWQTRDTFLSSAHARLVHGESVYTVNIDNRLVHYGWMIAGQVEFYVAEVKQSIELPSGSVVFYDYYSLPKFRGKGFYRTTVGHMLSVAFSLQATQYAYMAVLADNLPARHVIEAMGFLYQGSCYWQRRFGTEKKWKDPVFALSEREHIV